MAVRTRRDVWKLSVGTLDAARTRKWHPVLDGYARGVGAMMARGASSVDSWLWAANTHGVPPGTQLRPLWDQCEHASPFFLPWHRAYLAWFERTIQGHISEPGWALPYWDYTDPGQTRTLQLPPEFRVRQRTVNGALADNPLYVDRPGRAFAEDVEIVAALAERRFVRPRPRPGFGGADGAGRVFGLIESEPHNFVHVDVGGLMETPTLAGRDPIFWLHHANIDRLWDVWRQLSGSLELLAQTDVSAQLAGEWSSAVFRFGGGRSVTTFRIGDLMRTTARPLEYRYETLQLPAAQLQAITAARAAAAAGGGPMGIDEAEPEERWEPVSAVEGVEVGAAGTEHLMPFDIAQLGLDATEPQGVIIELAGVRATDPSEVYVVDVAAEPGGTMHRAGRFATFGLAGTPPDEERTFVVDATDVIPELVEEGWSGAELAVRVQPDPDRDGRDLTGEEAIRIGQITVYVRT